MTEDAKKPHVEFSMSDSPITAALQSLGIGDDAGRQRTAEGKSWPLADAWEPYRDARAGLIRRPLAESERDAIETLIDRVEKGFAAWLAARPAADLPDAATLRQLAADLAGAEAPIYGGAHRTFPYFARYFLLESALFAQRMAIGDATGADQLAKVKLWWRSRAYLQAAFQGAYAERSGEIVVRYTGALRDRIFLEDAATGEALTHDVAKGGQNDVELRRVQEFLASRAAFRHVRDLHIEDGAKVLEFAHATIAVTAKSRIQQDELVDASKFWPEQRERAEAEIEANRLAAGSALDRLLISPLAAQEEAEAAAAAILLAAPQAAGGEDRAAPEYWGYLETIIPGVIGIIPVVGSAVSVVFATYLKLLGGLIYSDKPDPLIEFEKKMQALIFDKIAQADANWINNMLKGIEDELRAFLRDYEKAPKPLAANSPLRSRGINLYQKVLVNKHHLLTPASGSYYKVAPYFWRYFICYLSAADIAKQMGDVRDFKGLRKSFYGDIQNLVYEALHGICWERRYYRIDIMNTSNGCKSDIKEVYDYRVGKKYSSDLRDQPSAQHHHANVACQWAAGTATAIQLMREMSAALDEVVNRDTEVTNNSATGFKPGGIGDTFAGALEYHKGQVWSGYELLRRAGITHLVHADVGKMEGSVKAQRLVTETRFPGDTIFKL